jgi:hypothetical protein
MKINDKIISIPPYISTNWNSIAAIHMKGNLLVVSLVDGDTINIPGLKHETIEMVFNFHALHLEKETNRAPSEKLQALSGKMTPDQIIELPFRLGFGVFDGVATPFNIILHK